MTTSMMRTLDDFLREIPLKGKDVTIVGPNIHVRDDPSLLYFANRMSSQPGTLTVIDREPHYSEESHGDIHTHLEDLASVAWKGVRIKEPKVVIGDVTKLELPSRFDLIYDCETFKCIVNYKTARSRSNLYAPHVKAMMDTYHRMLKKGGKALLVHFDGYEFDVGYDTLKSLLEENRRFSWEELRPFSHLYQMRSINRERVQERGRKNPDWTENFSTNITLDKDGYVTLGSRAPMRVIVLEKR